MSSSKGNSSCSNLVDSGMSKAASRVAMENWKVRARITVCHNAESTEDAELLMKMLGIHPTQKDEQELNTL